MSPSGSFIRRPLATSMLAIVLAGLFGYTSFSRRREPITRSHPRTAGAKARVADAQHGFPPSRERRGRSYPRAAGAKPRARQVIA